MNNENDIIFEELETFDDIIAERNAYRAKASRKRKNDVKKKMNKKRIAKSLYGSYGTVKETKNGSEYVKPSKKIETRKFYKKQTHRRNRRKPIDYDFGRKGNRYKKELDIGFQLD